MRIHPDLVKQQVEDRVKPYYFTQVVANRVMEMTDFLAQIPELAYRDNTQSYTDENGIEQINYRSCEIFIPDQSSVFYHAVKNVINDINPPSTKKTILPRVEYIWTDLKDGLLSGEACKNSIKVPFIKGTEPTKIPDVRRKCASKKQLSTETILDRLREVFEGGQG